MEPCIGMGPAARRPRSAVAGLRDHRVRAQHGRQGCRLRRELDGAADIAFPLSRRQAHGDGIRPSALVIGTVFFLYKLRDIAIYVTTFSIGHSTTLLLGVLGGVHINPYLVDAVIGLSVVYIAFDNLGGFKTLLGIQPNTKLAILGFGLVHGFGLATKVQGLNPSADGLVPNMLSFNFGIEIGQLLVLCAALAVIVWWRKSEGFSRQAIVANALFMAAGFALMEYQLAFYFTGAA